VISETVMLLHFEVFSCDGKFWWSCADTLLRFSQKWITNGRHSYATLFILQTIFQRYTPEQLDSLPDFRKSIEGLVMYTGTLLGVVSYK